MEPLQNIYAEDPIPIFHEYFGDPRPHPNEVLKLFHELKVEFALPFAFYHACAAGINSLTSTDPAVRLPPILLSKAVRGFYEIQKSEWELARLILLIDRKSHTSRLCRFVNLGSTHPELPLQDILRVIHNSSRTPPGGILHLPDFPTNANCADCVRSWNEIINQAKEKLRGSLLEIFGIEDLYDGW